MNLELDWSVLCKEEVQHNMWRLFYNSFIAAAADNPRHAQLIHHLHHEGPVVLQSAVRHVRVQRRIEIVVASAFAVERAI